MEKDLVFYKLNSSLYLRSLKKEDLNIKYYSWFQDQNITNFSSHGKFTKSLKFYRDNILSSIDNKSACVLSIIYKKKHIGNVALSNISLINRSAEFSIIIGQKNNHQKKIGLNVCKMIIKHGFEKLNLNRIYCGTSQNNNAMKKIAILVGMNLEGIRKSAIFLNNKYYDQYDYGILKKNYNSDKFHL